MQASLQLPNFAKSKDDGSKASGSTTSTKVVARSPATPITIVIPPAKISPSNLIAPRLTTPRPVSTPRTTSQSVQTPRSAPRQVAPTTPAYNSNMLVPPSLGTPRQQPVTPSTLRGPATKQGQIPMTPSVFRQAIKTPMQQHIVIENDPWMPERPSRPPDIKIIGITPVGTIPAVPTAEKRPDTPRYGPMTPHRSLTLEVVDPNTKVATIDPILTSAIYLDCTKPEDQDYNHVANRMRTISTTVSALRKSYQTSYRQVPALRGHVTHTQFEDALSAYENNQVYFQDRLDNKDMPIADINRHLTELEHWFMCIIEPRPRDDVDDWRRREASKIANKFSAYCDPELHKHIQPAPESVINYIRFYQQSVL
jgi:hypothetical protein